MNLSSRRPRRDERRAHLPFIFSPQDRKKQRERESGLGETISERCLVAGTTNTETRSPALIPLRLCDKSRCFRQAVPMRHREKHRLRPQATCLPDRQGKVGGTARVEKIIHIARIRQRLPSRLNTPHHADESFRMRIECRSLTTDMAQSVPSEPAGKPLRSV